jgi:hypothetical protein
MIQGGSNAQGRHGGLGRSGGTSGATPQALATIDTTSNAPVAFEYYRLFEGKIMLLCLKR